jgi:glycosyltransferase involved in cell wall biosynthesis
MYAEKISLLTGGNDPSYALPLLSSLVSKGTKVDFIGNDEMQRAENVRHKNVNYLNLRGDQTQNVPAKEKLLRVMKYYFRLLKYAAKTDSKLFHILWLNKFVLFDSTLLNVYYKMLGKKIVFTAHNVNAGERDGNDSLLNRLTLWSLYRIVDHIFVHTNKMKQKLIVDFRIKGEKITVIPFGINNYVPNTALTTEEARGKLRLEGQQKIILFFGRIAEYKGLDLLIKGLPKLKESQNDFKLFIAGTVKEGNRKYWENIQKIVEDSNLSAHVIRKIEFIPDEEIEIYFKAADVLILPYKHIFQSGVPFLSYNFGLPVIATDVGSLREDVIDGQTGFICNPADPNDLAEKIALYFQSDLYKNLNENRIKIMEYANDKYSWEKVGQITCGVYRNLLH